MSWYYNYNNRPTIETDEGIKAKSKRGAFVKSWWATRWIEAMEQLMGAEAALTGSLGRLFALAEAYPDLKANANMLSLQEELTSTEDKVSYAREGFNNAVTRYNIYRESFPDLIIASLFKFGAAKLFEVDTPQQREAPKVSFS